MTKSRSKAKKQLADGLAMVLTAMTPEKWIKEEPPCMQDAKKVGDYWIVSVLFAGHRFDIKATSDSFKILEEAEV